MSRVVDITEKLNNEEAPELQIRDTKIHVNTDAATMLKIMGILSEGEDVGPKEVIRMYELIFPENEREKIEELKLNFADFKTLLYAAINLVTGETQEGEVQTHTTT